MAGDIEPREVLPLVTSSTTDERPSRLGFARLGVTVVFTAGMVADTGPSVADFL